MPRKKTIKTVVRRKGRTPALSAQSVLEKARDAEKEQKLAIRKARSAVVAARRISRQSRTKTAANAYEKSKLSLQRAMDKSARASAKVAEAQAKVNKERLDMRAAQRVEAVQERMARRKDTLNRQGEKAIVEALGKYEVRWRKRRMKSDQKKLRLYEKQLKAKMRAAQAKDTQRLRASGKKGRKKRKSA